MQIMTAKTTTIGTLYVHVVLNGGIFYKFHMILFHMLDTSVRFFPSISLINYATAKYNLDR